jgi:hypothetical protein
MATVSIKRCSHFTASAPNPLSVCDLTHVTTARVFAHTAFVIDA